jgi:hypothetical protein
MQERRLKNLGLLVRACCAMLRWQAKCVASPTACMRVQSQTSNKYYCGALQDKDGDTTWDSLFEDSMF